jgi:NADPH2:quinone reductase
MYRKGVNLLTYGGMVEPPERTRRALEQVLDELASGRLRVPIDEILPLEAAADAHRRILERRVTGKLLLKP